MPDSSEERNIKPYQSHGVDLSWRSGEKEARGICPFCDKKKFYVCIDKGLYKCMVCGVSGNLVEFIRGLHALSFNATTTNEYEELAENRGLMDYMTLLKWGLAKSTLTDQWLLPGYNHEGKMTNLYRYSKKVLYPTTNLTHAIHGVDLMEPKVRTIDITEGSWDGMALWELFSQTKRTKENRLVPTNSSKNMLKERAVLAVPGCCTWSSAWNTLFVGKVVNLWYDNDHPRKNEKTGEDIAPAGLQGMERVAGRLGEGPLEINYLKWGDDGDGYSLEYPSGMDVRDYLALEV